MMKKHIIGITSIVLFIATGYFLFFKISITKTEKIGSTPAEEWFGIYFSGKKIGYQVVSKLPLEKGVKFIEKMYLKVTMLGKNVNAISYGEAESSSDGKLQRFDFVLSSGDMKFHAKGEKTGNTLKVIIKTGEDKKEINIPYNENMLVPMTILSAYEKVKEEKVVKYPFFDPSTLSTDYVTLRFKGYEEIEVMGKKVNAMVIEEEFREIRGDLYIDENGSLLREKSGLGMEIIREDPKSAIEKGWEKGVDIITLSAVPLINHTGVPLTSAKKATIKISNWEGTPPPGFQPAEGGVIGTFSMPKLDSKEEGTLGEGMFLEPEPLLQVNSPQIQFRAKEIVGESNDNLEKAKKIYEWVFTNLKKEPSFTIPSAVDVLNSMKGDCNEHAILFTALARAAGVPARVAVGLVQQGEFMFYHAWAEIFYKDWIPVDPTLGQFPADLSHIKLGEGGISEWVDAIKGLGKIKIEVIKAE